MVPARVVILSGHSLFAEGVASLLGQYPELAEVSIMSPQEGDFADGLAKTKPTVVIMDANDEDTVSIGPIIALMRLIPDLKIIHLDSQKEQVQVIKSEHYPVPEVKDLFKVII